MADAEQKTEAAPDRATDSAGAPESEGTLATSVEKPADAPKSAESVVDASVESAAEDHPKPKKRRDGHLYQIDFVRLFTFGSVILDHVILQLATSADVAAHGLGLLFRYTRYCFFALTGFVLTYQYRNRDLHAPTFWRRRYKLIGLPFVAWTLFYWGKRHFEYGGVNGIVELFTDPSTGLLALKSLVYELITGDAAYHLYFLSVSMQIYLVFPLVLWVIKRTWGYHRYILAASLAFHLWLLFHMVRPPLAIFQISPLDKLWAHMSITLLPYQFFILAGCLAAYHFDAFARTMRRYRAPLVVISLIAIVVTLIYYVAIVDSDGPGPVTGEEMFRATNVFMVHNSFALVGIIIILYICGTIWQDRRRNGSLADNVMRVAADRSFGIYLAHVAALSAVVVTSRGLLDDIPLWLNITVTYLVTVIVTVYWVEALRRSPISLITTGRERINWRIQQWTRSAVVGVVGAAVGLTIYATFNEPLGVLVTGISALLLLSAAVVAVKQAKAARTAEVAA